VLTDLLNAVSTSSSARHARERRGPALHVLSSAVEMLFYWASWCPASPWSCLPGTGICHIALTGMARSLAPRAGSKRRCRERCRPRSRHRGGRQVGAGSGSRRPDGQGRFDRDAGDVARSILDDRVDLEPTVVAVMAQFACWPDQMSRRDSSNSTKDSSSAPNGARGRSSARASVGISVAEQRRGRFVVVGRGGAQALAKASWSRGTQHRADLPFREAFTAM
jgi:hypothetical protein